MATKKTHNLDIQNLYLLNYPTKLLIAALIVAGIMALGYFALFRGQLETLSTQENKEITLKESYTKKSIEAASLTNLKAELESIRSAFDVLLRQLPTDAEIPTLLQELHQAASSNGLRLDSVIPQARTNDGPIQKLPYEVAITGKYRQINQFTRDVGELSRIITLESLKIGSASTNRNLTGKDNPSDLLTLRAIATTYKARPIEELEAEAAAEQKAEQDKSKKQNKDKEK